MPYIVRPFKGKYKVVNKETGRVLGTHDSEAKANRQMRAVYANEKKKK